jgi:hypothetical protein
LVLAAVEMVRRARRRVERSKIEVLLKTDIFPKMAIISGQIDEMI